MQRRRAEGKLKNLEAKLAAAPLGGAIGIGHTRWATHGKPTETNAHPHASPRLAVVHNGIIENFRALRQELAAKGYAFATETDSEIAAFVVEDELAKGKSPQEAVQAALGRLRGAFALVYLFEGEENLLIGARQGAPLAIGYGEGEMYLGSDALALAPFTDRIAYLEEGDWVVLTREGADIREASGNQVERRIQRSPAGSLLAEKGNYRHFMAKEIHEQPEVVGHTLARYIDMAALKLKPFAWPADPKRLTRVTIVACGTAYMAGLVGKYWIERWARLPVEIDVASEYRYREAPVDDGGLDHCRVAIGRDGGHAGLAALREGRGSEDDRRRQRAGFQHRAIDGRRRPDARRPRDRRRLDQGLHLPARGPGGAGDSLRQSARRRSTKRPRRRWSANWSRRLAFWPRRSSSSPPPRSLRMWSPALATCSTWAAARPIRWRSKAR